jgi:HSP20 family protein
MRYFYAGPDQAAHRELPKTRRFLAAWCRAKSAQSLTRNAKRRGLVPFSMARKEIEIMKTLTTWNPFRELDEVQNRLTTWFGGFPTRLFENGNGLRVADWSPQVDVIEDDKEYVIKADLPEMNKDEVKVTMENGVLCISGERKTEKEEKNKKYHRIERSFGSFERAFMMPEDADANKIAAEFKDGVLKVHLPKTPAAKPKPIEVKVQ